MEYLNIIESVLTLVTFVGVLWSAFKWIDGTNKIHKDIKAIRKEQHIHSKAIFGLLDGQHQQGLNHKSQESYQMMVDYLNEAAHNED